MSKTVVQILLEDMSKCEKYEEFCRKFSKNKKHYKELEKQQLIDAYIHRINDTFNNRYEAEQYYNLKFKDNETDPK